MFRQIYLRLIRTFLLSWIIYTGISSAAKFNEADFDNVSPTPTPTTRSSTTTTVIPIPPSMSPTLTRPTSAPAFRSSLTPTIQTVDYTVMQV